MATESIAEGVYRWLRDSVIGLTLLLLLLAAFFYFLKQTVAVEPPATAASANQQQGQARGTAEEPANPASAPVAPPRQSEGRAFLALVLDGFASGFVSTALLNLMWHLVIERRREESGLALFAKVVEKQPNLIREVIDSLSLDVRKTVCKSTFMSILGNAPGERLYENSVKLMLERAQRIRYEQICELDVYKGLAPHDSFDVPSLPQSDQTLLESQLWIYERSGYRVESTLINPRTSTIDVLFVFDIASLHRDFDINEYYWREMISVGEPVRRVFQSLNASEAMQLLAFEAHADPIAPLDAQASWTENKAALRVSVAPSVDGRTCIMRYRFPQDESVNWVIIVSPEPTVSPRMECQLHISAKRLTFIPFFERRRQSNSASSFSRNRCKIALDGYISERSGAVFIW